MRYQRRPIDPTDYNGVRDVIDSARRSNVYKQKKKKTWT